MDEKPTTRCQNCDAALQGPFCARCGQKHLPANERTLAKYWSHFAQEFSVLDSRLWSSLKLLLIKPGALSAQYIAGVRARYMSPLSLFLLAFFLFFLMPVMTDFTLSLREHVELQPYSSWIKPAVEARLQQRQIEFDHYAQTFLEQEQNIASTAVLLHIPILAFLLAFLHWRRPFVYLDHLIVSLHLFASMLAWALALSFLVFGPLGYLLTALDIERTRALNNMLKLFIVLPAFLTLIALTLWRAYQQPLRRVLLKLPFTFAAILIAHMIYRFIVFWLTYWRT